MTFSSFLLSEAGAFVLFWLCDLLLQNRGSTQRPIWIAEQFASQQDDISLSGCDNVLSLLRSGDIPTAAVRISASWRTRSASGV